MPVIDCARPVLLLLGQCTDWGSYSILIRLPLAYQLLVECPPRLIHSSLISGAIDTMSVPPLPPQPPPLTQITEYDLLTNRMFFLFANRFICQQSGMDSVACSAGFAPGYCRFPGVWQIGPCSPLPHRLLHARRVARRRPIQEGDLHRRTVVPAPHPRRRRIA